MTILLSDTSKKKTRVAIGKSSFSVEVKRPADNRSACRTSESLHPAQDVRQLLVDRFRCLPNDIAEFEIEGNLKRKPGYFRFGDNVIGYGKCSSGNPAESIVGNLPDAARDVIVRGTNVRLTFDPVQVVDNLRCERYLSDLKSGQTPLPANKFFRGLYYTLRPFMPIRIRKQLQRLYFKGRTKTPFPKWPVDPTVENIFEELLVLSMKARKIRKIPFIWFWPDGARSCSIVTHDVETQAGLNFCSQLMDIADSFRIKTSFQFVPEKRYEVTKTFLQNVRARGFEVNVHDLNHDGHLFSGQQQFSRRAKRINSYAKEFGARGFRSAVMYRNIDWYDDLDISYDMSVPNVAHLDAQQGGCCTVFPFFVGKILELPVTTTQDYSLFHILNDHSTDLWKRQITMVREKHGLINVIIHPDYIMDKAAEGVYAELLDYLSELRSAKETWTALPNEVDSWWRTRNELKLIPVGDSWTIAGKGSERARLAFAVLGEDRITYEIN
jgi:hypothetical protein